MTKKGKKKFYINDQYKRVQVFCECDEEWIIGGDGFQEEIEDYACPKCRYNYWIHQPKKIISHRC